jgi:tetratricopeptide (TPR) repeat protein
MYRANPGLSHVFLAAAQTVMAEIEAAQGHWDQAQLLAQQSVEWNRADFPPDHPATARAQSVLGWALWKQGKATEAAPELESAYRIDRKVFRDPSGTRQSAQVVARWMSFLRAAGRIDEVKRVEAESGLGAKGVYRGR